MRIDGWWDTLDLGIRRDSLLQSRNNYALFAEEFESVLTPYNKDDTLTLMTDLPTLYKRNSNGSIQQWTISVEGSTLVKVFGQKDGKLQEARDTISVGKNVGRANETTPAEQAYLEAKAQHEKKMKKGYVLSVDDAADGLVDETIIKGGVEPMLAHTFEKQGHKIVWPAYTQPKLDGHRMIAMRSNNVWTLWSRTRKQITSLPHITAALADLPFVHDVILDGEAYNHDYREKFEKLTSLIKRPTPTPESEIVQYHVYDVVSDAPYIQRYAVLAGLLDSPPIKFVETHKVANEDEAWVAFADFIERGFEGSMLRNANSPYENKRSYSLIKVKAMADDEFRIVDVAEGRGRMAGCAIFICETEAGNTFRVKMKGTLGSLKQYVDDPSLAVGKDLVVQYQNLTAEGMPRFPVGLRIHQEA